METKARQALGRGHVIRVIENSRGRPVRERGLYEVIADPRATHGNKGRDFRGAFTRLQKSGIWLDLDKIDKASMSQIIKSLKANDNLIFQAVEWLAREDKLVIEKNGRFITYSLKPQR